MKVSPSLLSADFGNLADDVKMVNESLADYVHIDVMDGVFVPNISFGFPVMKHIQRLRRAPDDCGAAKVCATSRRLRSNLDDRSLRSLHALEPRGAANP